MTARRTRDAEEWLAGVARSPFERRRGGWSTRVPGEWATRGDLSKGFGKCTRVSCGRQRRRETKGLVSRGMEEHNERPLRASGGERELEAERGGGPGAAGKLSLARVRSRPSAVEPTALIVNAESSARPPALTRRREGQRRRTAISPTASPTLDGRASRTKGVQKATHHLQQSLMNEEGELEGDRANSWYVTVGVGATTRGASVGWLGNALVVQAQDSVC